MANTKFDGDEINFSVSLDKKMAEFWYPLEYKFNILTMNKPLELSGNLSIPNPVISSISNWMERN